jgi:hypothetical protein
MKSAFRPSSNLTEEFRARATLYSQRVGRAGTQIEPFPSSSNPLHFDRLEDSEKRAVISRLTDDLELFDQLEGEGFSLRDSSKLLWRYLHKGGFIPCSDIFDKIEDEDVVSLYSLEQKQIFQNLRFFDFVSLTLDDLFCSHWYAHSTRDASIEEAIYKIGVSFATGKLKGTIDPGLPVHVAQEVGTPDLMRFNIKIKYLSPVFTNSQISGIISVNRCTWIEA